MAKKLYPESAVQDIADAIRAKNGSSETYTIEEMAQAIIDIPTGGGEVEKKDVNFYDIDGKRLYSYTKAEYLALNELPALPTRLLLTSMGWNWTKAEITDQVNATGECDAIGATYRLTDNSKSYVVVELPADKLYVEMGFWIPEPGTIIVDWGDGNTSSAASDSFNGDEPKYVSNTYSEPGRYVITIINSDPGFFLMDECYNPDGDPRPIDESPYRGIFFHAGGRTPDSEITYGEQRCIFTSYEDCIKELYIGESYDSVTYADHSGIILSGVNLDILVIDEHRGMLNIRFAYSSINIAILRAPNDTNIDDMFDAIRNDIDHLVLLPVLPDSAYARAVDYDETNLKSIIYGNQSTCIRNQQNSCQLELVSLPGSQGMGASMEQIKSECFKGCEKLKYITLPSYLYAIGDHAFFGTDISKILWRYQGAVSVQYHLDAFYGMYNLGILDLEKAAGVTTIDCTELWFASIRAKYITLPSTLRHMKITCFDDGITIKFTSSTPPEFDWDSSQGLPNYWNILVPQAYLDAYRQAYSWIITEHHWTVTGY